jgi:DNA repair exonuclease SbcCD ATPase subunit
MAKIVKFIPKFLGNSKKSGIFEKENEPTALAFTDFSKPVPTLRGKDAERFIKQLEENERKAKERKNIPSTLEELKRKYSCSKILLEFDKEELRQREEELKKLENKIKELEKLNGKTKG